MKNEDRKRLDSLRSSAAQYFAERYSREERYLIIFERDFSDYLKRADYLRSKDVEHQLYFDFLIAFDSLKSKMAEFKWSAGFLKKKGIDFPKIRNLYFAVA